MHFLGVTYALMQVETKNTEWAYSFRVFQLKRSCYHLSVAIWTIHAAICQYHMNYLM
jgi:hypothetical protein